MKNIKIVFAIVLLILLVIYIRNIYDIICDNKSTNGESYQYQNIEDIRKILKSKKDKIIVIDPGHGGVDPGKVGNNNELEKNINLSIAFKLRDYLVSHGFSVIMTRNSDIGLYSDTDRNKKNSDLRNRVNLINESDAIAVVSIHQNSFASEKERGAQVFYHEKSIISKNMAKDVQEALKEYHDKDNKRVEKANTSYYILKKTIKPTIIIECGFLSNYEEAKNLITDTYQDNVAKAIGNGIVVWANKILASVYWFFYAIRVYLSTQIKVQVII